MDCEVSGLTWDHRPNHSALLMFVTVSLILFAYTIHERGSLWNDKWRPTCETNLHSIVRSCKGGRGKKRVLLVFQTVLHYFDNMKLKLTPLLTIINVPGLFEHYSSVHIILKRRKKKCLFCHRCGLLGNAYAPPRRFVLLVCWQLDFESIVGHFLILHFSLAFLC